MFCILYLLGNLLNLTRSFGSLHLRLQDEQLNHRDLNPELARQGRVPSKTNETKEAVQGRALDLLNAVEEYQNRVIVSSLFQSELHMLTSRRQHASRNASAVGSPAFPDEEPTQPEPEPALVAEASPSTSNAPTLVEPVLESLPPSRPPSASRLALPSFVRSSESPNRVSNLKLVAKLQLDVGLMKRIDSRNISSSLSATESTAYSVLESAC